MSESTESLLSLLVVEKGLAENLQWRRPEEGGGNISAIAEADKMAAVVSCVREEARKTCQAISEVEFELEYKTALLAQTLRIFLYPQYLNERQQEYSVISAAILADRVLNMVDGR